MSNKNTKKPTSDSVEPFNWCSHSRFLFRFGHGYHKISKPPPSTSSKSSRSATQVISSPDYKKRLSDLERDIDTLKARVTADKEQHHRTKKPRAGEKKDAEMAASMRFPDGSFLHGITRIGKPWERLCMHVSSPTIAEEATTAAEVLQRMTTMNANDMCKCLMSLMPMADITGLKSLDPTCQSYLPENEIEFLMESILSNSVKKFEQLVLEGLKIQMGAIRRRSANYTQATDVAGTDLKAKPNGSTGNNDPAVLVVLIQMRDPNEDFGSVGELMIGLIEAQLGENGELHFTIEGVHVAGLNLTRKKIDGRDFMWSLSMKCCGGSDGSRAITRNPDRLFPSRS